jgi:hypothetical protein
MLLVFADRDKNRFDVFVLPPLPLNPVRGGLDAGQGLRLSQL